MLSIVARIQRGPYADGSVDVRVTGRYADLLTGELDIEDLDIEELARGQLKDKNGRFTGRPPKFLPRQIVDKMRTEHHRRVNAVLEESLSDVVKVMRGVAKDRKADPAVRLKAAIYIYERFMGKVPDKIDVTKGAKVETIVEQILYDMEPTAIEKEIAETEEELSRPPKSRKKAVGKVAKRQTR